MLARQLLIGFLAVIVPSTILLGAVTFHALASMDRLAEEFVQISRADEALTNLHLTLTRAGTSLTAFLVGHGPLDRKRFEELVRAAEERIRSCGAASCHSPIRSSCASRCSARMAWRSPPRADVHARPRRTNSALTDRASTVRRPSLRP